MDSNPYLLDARADQGLGELQCLVRRLRRQHGPYRGLLHVATGRYLPSVERVDLLDIQRATRFAICKPGLNRLLHIDLTSSRPTWRFLEAAR